MNVLEARDAYRLWAPTYESETAISHLEDQVVEALGVSTHDRRILDVGCGTGRRIRDVDAALAVGVDLTPAMLSSGRISDGAALLVAGDACQLPLPGDSFDVVWCRLMIGHVRDARRVFGELARVCRPNGAVIVSDVCAEAIAAGHRRTFRDGKGEVHEVEHFVHSADDQCRAARVAGLTVDRLVDGVVGEEIRSFYEAAGRLAAFEAQRGLPIVRVALLLKQVA